jgi:hypothetical protein
LHCSPLLTVLFCSVLFCSVLFCSVLFCSVLFCSVLFCSVLFCSFLLYSALSCPTLLYFTLPSSAPHLTPPSSPQLTDEGHIPDVAEKFWPRDFVVAQGIFVVVVDVIAVDSVDFLLEAAGVAQKGVDGVAQGVDGVHDELEVSSMIRGTLNG